ncbi:hypothetical protein GCM10027037_26080 [Mucilaginibacter koreensis]
MKYFIFVLSVLLIIGIVINLITLQLDYSKLSRFGYGYMTGEILLLVLLSLAVFFSGKKILKSYYAGIEV